MDEGLDLFTTKKAFDDLYYTLMILKEVYDWPNLKLDPAFARPVGAWNGGNALDDYVHGWT